MPTDLQAARVQCKVDVKAVGDILLSPEQRRVRERVADVLEKEELWDLSVRPHLNQIQQLYRSLQLCKRILQLRTQYQWTPAEYHEVIRKSDDNLPISLHETAFIPMVLSQGTDEQQQKWLSKCRRLEYVGCYAQTELAHGSNVQGLITTATWDGVNGRDEFIIDSGGVEGTKWWIGGAGVLANFALVQAILRVPDRTTGEMKSLGPHLFVVPIRDLETHLPLPGVQVGDQGPKAYGGFAATDNGYINFDKVRIPRENMLMRFAKLDKDGVYTPAKHDKLSYGSMVALRAGIPKQMGWVVGKAVTTAIRYCIARRQFNLTGNETAEETQVIHYASVKHRLFPILALSYAYILSGQKCLEMYSQLLDRLLKLGDVGMLAEMHSLSTALKVSSTSDGCRSLEEARKAMGGHGFSWMSGVGGWFANMTATQTYEGENYVIAQQTARGLLKHLNGLRESGADYKLPESSEYLRRIFSGSGKKPVSHSADTTPQRFWRNPDNLVKILEARAAYLIGRLAIAVATEKEKQWTDFSFSTFAIARAHAELYIVKQFFSAIAVPGVPKALKKLALLHGLATVVAGLSDLLEAEEITASEAREVREVYNWLVEQELSVPEVVGLTDAFGFRDWEIGLLGNSEGRVYERMWDEVRWKERDERKRELVRRWEGATWEGMREEAMKVLRYWREADEGQKAKL